MNFNISHYDKELLEAIIRFNAHFIELYSDCPGNEKAFRKEYESLKLLIDEWISREFKETGTIEWAKAVLEKFETGIIKQDLIKSLENNSIYN